MIQKNASTSTSVNAKWGSEVATGGYGSGWTAIPSALIRNLGELDISATDFAVLSVILSYWWSADDWPAPRPAGIARLLGVTPRTVQRSIQRLSDRNLLIREPSVQTPSGARRHFDLSPLVKKVSELAERDRRLLTAERKQRKMERQQTAGGEFIALD